MDFEPLTYLFKRLGTEAYPWYVLLAELVLIGLVVNWCAGVLHGTRGTRLLRGLLVVLIAATLIVRVLAGELEWTRLALLYRYFIIGMAFIALVAFQPELRRALIRAGDVRFFRRRLPSDKLIAALLESAGYLSRNRYGALIAIQRDVGLANWVENGTQLNAEVSAPLLNSIFFPNSALHDLGVVIRGTRILAAGCQFPAAESGEVDVSLGSRHRAAVGLSMESDALVLVVSEETGTISLADRGKLARFLALDDLQEALETRLTGGYATPRRRRVRTTASDVWRLARRLLVVVPLTCVIWFLADRASLVTADGVDVELHIPDTGTLHVDVEQPRPPVLTLDLEGPRRDIDALRPAVPGQPLKLQWTLPPLYARPGRQELDAQQLRAVIAGLPELETRGIFVKHVTPEAFAFYVHEVVSVEAEVRVDAGALRVKVEHVEPERVQVWLRRSDLERVPQDQRYVEADLEDLLAGRPRNQPLSFTGVPLGPRLGDFEILRMEPSTVDLTVRVLAETIRKRLEGVRVRLAVSPQIWKQYKIEYPDANEWLLEIEVEGDENIVGPLRPQDVSALVPLSSDQALPSAEYRSMEVVIHLPKGVTLVGPSRTVQFRLAPREGVTP